MALQMYVQPRGGELIAQGITQAASSLSGAMIKKAETKGIVEGMKKIAKADPEFASSLGITDESDWDNFSPNQIKGLYEGMKLRSLGKQEQLQDQQLWGAQAQNQSRYQQMLQEGAETDMLANLAQFQRNPNQPLSPVFQERYAAMLENPGVQQAVDFYQTTGQPPSQAFLDRYGKLAEEPWRSTTYDVDGIPVLATSPQSVQIHPAYKAQLEKEQMEFERGLKKQDPGRPTLSEDGRFYLTPNGWRPIPEYAIPKIPGAQDTQAESRDPFAVSMPELKY